MKARSIGPSGASETLDLTVSLLTKKTHFVIFSDLNWFDQCPVAYAGISKGGGDGLGGKSLDNWTRGLGRSSRPLGPWRFESNAATRKHIMVKQKYFKGANERLGGGQKYTKYNKINNNLKTPGGQDCCQGCFQRSGA